MTKVDFDRDELEAWLARQPREIISVLSMRACLRLIPSLFCSVNRDTNYIDENYAYWILKSFQNVYSVRGVLVSCGKKFDLNYDSVSGQMKDIFIDRFLLPQFVRVVSCLGYCASVNDKDLVSRAASSIYSSPVAIAGAAEITAGSLNGRSVSERVFRHARQAYVDDVSLAQNGFSAENFLGESLWLNRRLKWFDESWSKLKTSLLARNEYWNFWIEWYEECLLGDSIFVVRDKYSSLLSGKIDISVWLQGPGIVNARINELIAEQSAPDEVIHQASSVEDDLDVLSDYAGRMQYGSPVLVSGQYFQLDLAGSETDQSIAEKGDVLSRFPRIQKNLSRLEQSCRERLGNYPTWADLIEDCGDLLEIMNSGINEFANRIGEVWELSVSIGSFAEFDDKLQAQRNSDLDPLPDEIRRRLDAVLASIGPYLREFPTAQRLDEEHRRWQSDKEVARQAEDLVDAVRRHELMQERWIRMLEKALAHAGSDDLQSRKAAGWGVGSVKRLMLASVVSGLTFAGTSVAGGFFNKAGEDLADKTFNLTEEKAEEIAELLSDAPADVRAALRHLLTEMKSQSSLRIPTEKSRQGLPKPKPPKH